MDKYQETFETWDKIAQLYEDKFMELDIYNDSYNYFLSLLKEQNTSLLEVGCGPGNITKYLLNHQPYLNVIGIDISKNMIQLARKNNPSAAFKVMDCREIHHLKGSFDAILCGFVIPYLEKEDCSLFIKNASLLLKKQGIIYLSFVNGAYKNSNFITGSHGDRTYFYYYDTDKINRELQANALTFIKSFNIEYLKSDHSKEIHQIIIAKKI